MKGIKVVTKPDGRRYLYRRVGSQLVPLPDLPENDPAFLEAYLAAGRVQRKATRAPTGTIAALCAAYLGSREYASLAASTRAVWRRVLDRISTERGTGLVTDLRPDHIRKDVRALTPGAASMRLKAWRSILAYAVQEDMIPASPAAGVKAPKGIVTPHRRWTHDEIAAFRAHWQLGTMQRTAFEVIYWTGARCVDAVRLGWQMVDREGWLRFTQAKTGGPAASPIRAALPAWCAPLAEDRTLFLAAVPADRMLWIVTGTGKARSHKAVSQWMSAAARAAGLPDDCTAHGLRKARASELAEVGATASQLGAWLGHASLAESSLYTRETDKVTVLRGTAIGNRKPRVSKNAGKRNDFNGDL